MFLCYEYVGCYFIRRLVGTLVDLFIYFFVYLVSYLVSCFTSSLIYWSPDRYYNESSICMFRLSEKCRIISLVLNI
jgi:hypothetical protein